MPLDDRDPERRRLVEVGERDGRRAAETEYQGCDTEDLAHRNELAIRSAWRREQLPLEPQRQLVALPDQGIAGEVQLGRLRIAADRVDVAEEVRGAGDPERVLSVDADVIDASGGPDLLGEERPAALGDDELPVAVDVRDLVSAHVHFPRRAEQVGRDDVVVDAFPRD